MAAKQKVGKPATRQQTSTGTHTLVSTVNDNVSDNRKITSDDAAEAASDMVNKLRDEIQNLRCTMNTLQQQFGFLLTFVGVSDCNPTTKGTGDVIPSVGDGDTFSAATLSRLEDDGARNRQRPTQFQQSPLCQAVTAAVYVDIHSSELKAKNVRNVKGEVFVSTSRTSSSHAFIASMTTLKYFGLKFISVITVFTLPLVTIPLTPSTILSTL